MNGSDSQASSSMPVDSELNHLDPKTDQIHTEPAEGAAEIAQPDANMDIDDVVMQDVLQPESNDIEQELEQPLREQTPLPQPKRPLALLHEHIETQSSVPIPGIWWIHSGTNFPQIIPGSFQVQDESFRGAQVKMLCLPTELVVSALEVFSTPSFIESAPLVENAPTLLAKLRTTWPKKGSLLVEVNGVGCFPNDMDPEIPSPPLDVTRSIQIGTNTIRVLQLSVDGPKTFILLAHHPPLPEPDALTDFFEDCLAQQSTTSTLLHLGAFVS